MKKEVATSATKESSLTSIAVSSAAYQRSRYSEYGAFLDEEDYIIANHFIQTAIAAETNGIHWFLEAGIPKLPKTVQDLFFNKFIAQGYDALMLSRKLMIRNRIQNAIAEGVEQVVVLASGIDPRPFLESLRFKNKGVKFYDLERGQTRKNKLNALLTLPDVVEIEHLNSTWHADGTLQINDNLWLIEYDADTHDLCDLLSNHGFQKDKKTLVIAEGLMIYLNRQSAKRLLDSVYNLVDEGNEFFLSFNNSTKKSFLEGAILASAKEPYQLSMSPEKVVKFAAASGFDITGHIKHEDRLKFIADWENAAVYTKNQGGLKDEIYYRFIKSSNILKENPDTLSFDLPVIDMALSTVEETPSISLVNEAARF